MTDLFKEIAPWLCHICGGEFDSTFANMTNPRAELIDNE
jgi:hypothetical protein